MANTNHTISVPLIFVIFILIFISSYVTIQYRSRVQLRLMRSQAYDENDGQLPQGGASHLLGLLPTSVYHSKNSTDQTPPGSGGFLSPPSDVHLNHPPYENVAISRSSEDLSSIPVAIIGRNYTEDFQSPVCCICIRNISEGQIVRLLPCDHLYHVACIDDWLTTRSETCPLW